MESIELSTVPQYLRESTLYIALLQEAVEGTDESIEIPQNCFKANKVVNTFGEAAHLLHTCRYWGLREIPIEIIEFCLEQKEVSLGVLDEFKLEFPSLLTLQAVCEATNDERMNTAVRAGDISLVKQLGTFGYSMNINCAYTAATVGALDCLKLVMETGVCKWSSCLPSVAAENGHLHCLQYARENQCSWNNQVVYNAARKGHLNCLQYALVNNCPIHPDTAEIALLNNKMDCLVLAASHGCIMPIHVWNRLVCRKDSTLQRLMDAGCALPENILDSVVAAGWLEMLQQLHRQGYPWTVKTCTLAAKSRHLDCLKYLHENGCDWNVNTFHAAAKTGELPMLEYLYEEHCPWNADTCVSALYSSRKVDVLRFLHEKGCPWDESLCIKSVQGFIPILKLVKEGDWSLLHHQKEFFFSIFRS